MTDTNPLTAQGRWFHLHSDVTKSTYISTRMSAWEQFRAEKRRRRLMQLLVGLAGYGSALAFLVESRVGASSWNVLAEGIAERTGLSFGMATNLIAVAVLVFWVPLRELPGLGTLLNVVMVGLFADLTSYLLPPASSTQVQILYFAVGFLAFAFFDAVYLGARFGSGPRDGLMTGAVRVTGKPVWLVRIAIDATVVAIGWALGGVVGLGTVVMSLASGPLIHRFLNYTTVELKRDRVVPE